MSAATTSTAPLLRTGLAVGGMRRLQTLFSQSAARTDFRLICSARQCSRLRSEPRPGRIRWFASCFWNNFIGPRPFWRVTHITARERDHTKKPRPVSMQPTRNIPSYPDAADRSGVPHVRLPISIVLWCAGFLSAGLADMQLSPATAQLAGAAPQATASSPDAIKQREQELEATRTQQRNAAESQQKLKADIAAIGQDRSKLNAQLIDIAAQVRGVESRIGDAEARLNPLDTREQQIRGSLDSRRAEIAEVLAALQRAGRRTPPALLVRPEDALQSLRTAMLLGAVVPELRGRAERLAGDLTELVALRKNIAIERDRLALDRDKLRDDQTRLAALVDERQRKQSSIEQDMEAEGTRAIALSRQVDSLQGLIAKMEQ